MSVVEYPKEQVDELKRYCSAVKAFSEGAVTYLLLEGLCLPTGCKPSTCDALLGPQARDGYPSRLFLAEQVTSSYARNWNSTNVRIGERNWFAFSWKVETSNPTLVQLLLAHLNGFAKAS
jgi:hypothetical protein